jgi:opacity protein-like surface antigen
VKPSIEILSRALCVALLSAAAISPAAAADLPSATPTPAYTISPDETAIDPWHGLYVGTGVTSSFAKGAKSAWGGEAYGGYDHRFDNGLVLGAEFSTGYMPWASSDPRYKGFDYASAEAKLGYEMGRVTPYVLAGVALTKGSLYASAPDPGASFNALFSGPGAYQAQGYMGAGVEYQVNDRTKISVEGYVGQGASALTH